MLKKYIFVSFLVTLFCLCFDFVSAYEYVDSSNEKRVMDTIKLIYDMKAQYEELVGDYESTIDLKNLSSKSYWWPIGSVITTEYNGKLFASGEPETVHITSDFGYRNDPFNRGTLFHSGTDISGGRGLGNVNIIASKDGIVVYPTADVKNNCPSGNTLSNCGNGYGNYVIIQHSDGNYTLYAHMYEGSITVKAGDSVRQGQVIGKMGSSGNSTGAHLHFEVREGQNSFYATVNSLNYVSTVNTRTVDSNEQFITWLNSWQKTSVVDGEFYIVESMDDKYRFVGSSVILEKYADKFLEYGINVDDYPVGSKINTYAVDQIEFEIINSIRSNIQNILSNNSIILEENQMESLISIMYSAGNINEFVSYYNEYGNTQSLYDYWFKKFENNDNYTTKMIDAQWALFSNGMYVYNK